MFLLCNQFNSILVKEINDYTDSTVYLQDKPELRYLWWSFLETSSSSMYTHEDQNSDRIKLGTFQKI